MCWCNVYILPTEYYEELRRELERKVARLVEQKGELEARLHGGGRSKGEL